MSWNVFYHYLLKETHQECPIPKQIDWEKEDLIILALFYYGRILMIRHENNGKEIQVMI